MKTIHKAAWLCINPDGALLMARTKGQRLFYTVGGKIEPGESKVDALRREILEETGAVLLHETIAVWRTFEGVGIGAHTGDHVIIYTYFAYHRLPVAPHGEIEELKWFHLKDRHMTTDLGRGILAALAAEGMVT